MAYTPKTWITGEAIEATELNHMEQGIAEADAAATGTGTIGTQQLADGAVTNAKIADGAIYTEKLADDSVTYDKLDQNAVDSVNIRTGAVTMPKLGSDVIAELDNKAYIDGSYESMTVGNAEQLVSSVGIEDQTPYNFRTSGGSVDIGDRERVDAIVGGTIAWNQLCAIPATDISKTENNVTITDNRDGTFTVSTTASGASANAYVSLSNQNVPIVKDHKYLLAGTPSTGSASTYYSYIAGTATVYDYGKGIVFKATASGASTPVVVYVKQGSIITTPVTFKPQFFDLTAKFGSTIADYIYTLEQGTAGAGVAWFRKYFPKLFYGYSAPTLLSVKTSAHKMTGFNQWDEEWELGGYNTTTGEKESASSYFRCVNPIRVIPNTAYYYCSPLGGANVYFYDSDDNYLSYINVARNSTFTTPSNCGYMRFRVYSYGATYNHDICINISWDGERNGEYMPYQQWVYPLDSSLTLRGMLKLDASNNLYADGDRYLPDGTVERRYVEIDLGAQAWTAQSLSNNRVAYVTSYASWDDAPWIDKPTLTTPTPAVCVAFDHMVAQSASSLGTNVGVFTDTAATLPVKSFAIIKDSGIYADAAAFKAAMNNVKLVYKIATPTTETASPYQQTQIVDDFGTEEFVDAAVESGERDVAIPVGNETVYKPNLRAKLEMAPDSPDGDGDYIVRQTNGQNTYIPLVEVKELPDMPSEDGNYTLRCTVTNGTATLSWVSA